MSLFAPEDFGYLQQVEAFFVAHSQVGVMVSGRDLELIRHWRASGAPVEAICRGIDKAFAGLEEPPPSIHAARRFVETELHAWRERSVGAHSLAEDPSQGVPSVPGRGLPDPNRMHARDPQPPPEQAPWLASWTRSMNRLTELGHGSDDPRVREVYRWAYRQMRALRRDLEEATTATLRRASLALAIGEIEGGMFDHAFARLSLDEQAEIDGAMPDRIRRALRGMSAEAKGHQRRLWHRRALQERRLIEPFFVP